MTDDTMLLMLDAFDQELAECQALSTAIRQAYAARSLDLSLVQRLALRLRGGGPKAQDLLRQMFVGEARAVVMGRAVNELQPRLLELTRRILDFRLPSPYYNSGHLARILREVYGVSQSTLNRVITLARQAGETFSLPDEALDVEVGDVGGQVAFCPQHGQAYTLRRDGNFLACPDMACSYRVPVPIARPESTGV
jgi:hypothetical protein